MRDKILAVDDSRVMLRIVSGAIEMAGYEPLTARNGRLGLQVLAEHAEEIALVLLDWNMPEMNGIETLRAIKSDPAHAELPVMMVTTESERSNVIAAIQSGAKHYLTKPFSQEDLVTRIMECLGQGI